jgi:superfamily II DNA or RNA helicase
MLKLEDIKIGDQIIGIQQDDIVKIVQIETVGSSALTIYYKDSQGQVSEQMVFRDDESRLSLARSGRPWSFDAPGNAFKLGLEAYRISQAAFFDPMMAVHTSNIEPLPHQISAVYEAMLPKQPLRFVLADDPGAGKTIMAGLFIRELIMRADANCILIVTPGALTEQWQDELFEKFSLHFDIFSKEKQEQCVSGNFFDETNRLICRMDQLSRNESFLNKLRNTQWDLIIVDEAHKLSANYYGNKINKTKRFQLGELLGTITRHFLLMTATPHNGKEEDFQIWLSLLDNDRFYGKFREKAHKVDVSDLMRRMVKEDLLKFDGTRLFPERKAYTANYQLSPLEAALYHDVTTYVREEMNRADKLSGKKKNTVGFALTLLQRRLASSPEAIFQSLKRRRKRLEARLEETRLMAENNHVRPNAAAETLGEYTIKKQFDLPDNFDELDEELSAEAYELFAEQVVDQATAAVNIPELESEINSLKRLEHQALLVVKSGNDKKWEELSALLQDHPEMFTKTGNRRKIIIFTEHKDTLNYLVSRMGNMLGNPNAVCAIHGGISRDDRRRIQEEFRNNKDVFVLAATDAAGEGVNLQNANLMVNYDLPWNPNRLEQRFGRIHRIGQTQICHLWNIVANETREGLVFQRLFEKIEIERQALGGKVFDVLGEAFDNVSLKDLLIDAIRYGEDPDNKAKLNQVIDGALDSEHLKRILKRNALVEQYMSLSDLYLVKDEMEKAEARKLQPYFISAYFSEAFQHLGGEMRRREAGRFEIRHVPAVIRERDRVIGETRTPVVKKYERICFEKQHIHKYGKPLAQLMHPGHPLMQAMTDLILQAHRQKLKQGTVLLDPNDEGLEPRILFMVNHTVRETSAGQADNEKYIASRRLQFVEINEKGETTNAGWAPHLDLEPMDKEDLERVRDIIDAPWLNTNLETLALSHASKHLVPAHFQEVKSRRERQSNKVLAAVNDRLVKEINYCSDQYIKIKADVTAGKIQPMQLEKIRRSIDDLEARLAQRKSELTALKNVVSSTPVIIGGALVIPQGLMAYRKGDICYPKDAAARAHVEQVAMNAVMAAEIKLGHAVKDVSKDKCGWDITARPPVNPDGSIQPDRHIEVKGRSKGQNFITVTRNEMLYGLNQADKFILAIVIVDENNCDGPFYIRQPFQKEIDFGICSVNYDLKELMARSVAPENTV